MERSIPIEQRPDNKITLKRPVEADKSIRMFESLMVCMKIL